MSARCCALNQGLGNDRRQTLAMLLGGGLAGTAFGAPRQAWAGATQMAPLPGDEHFMQIAIAEAARGDFPFGAVIVRDGDVLSTGRIWAEPPTIRRRTGKWRRSASS
jgi:guanine deaminase